MKKVGEIVHHKSGITIPYYLEKTTFTCTCLERTVTAPDAKTLESSVRDMLEHWLQLEWHPVIKVETDDQDGWGRHTKAGVWLDCERMYLSRSPAGKVLSCDWEVAEIHRKARAIRMSDRDITLSHLPLIEPLHIGRRCIWCDYTEAKWKSLLEIKEGIKRLASRVNELVSTKEGNRLLELGTSHLLLEAKKK